MKPLTPPAATDPALTPAAAGAAGQLQTPARTTLGRAGSSMPTAEVLRFGLAHARARDAVQLGLDADTLAGDLRGQGFRVLQASSQATDRPTYLLRPDLGRRLDDRCALALAQEHPAPEIAVVVADGLSSTAVQRHALPLLACLRQALAADWALTPVVLVTQGRVAIGDDIGAALKARLVIVLIGERPGLSSPDSMGIYITYGPRRGRPDSERNCISNIRPEGLAYADAVHKLCYLVQQSLQLQLSGVGLKDNSDQARLAP